LSALDGILDKLAGVKQQGSGFIARCPAHEDRRQSLSVSTGDDGRVLLKCHAGCEVDSMLDAIGLVPADLFERREPRERGRVVAEYEYRDETGVLLYVVERHSPKKFLQKKPARGGGWEYRLNGVRRVPYRLADVRAAIAAGRWVLIVEGEKDVERLAPLKFAATCNAGGAGKWREEWSPIFEGAKVAIVPDNDVAGRKHAGQVGAWLSEVAADVRLVTLPDVGEHGDVSDWLAKGHDVAELRDLIGNAPTWHPLDEPSHSFPPENRATAQPPPLADEPRILDRFRSEVRGRGLVGEERNAATLYLVLTSRLLDRQVSAGVKGHSSSGKSWTVQTVVEYFPRDAVIEFTAMSERALVYSTQEFKHRTLVVYELTGLREGVEDDMTSYFVRTLLSEGRIDYEVTVRDKEGGFTTKKIVKEGPTNLIFTTTKTRVHAENETRVLSLHTDDSSEQTARVLAELANESNGARADEEWQALQRWLAVADNEVTIPFAAALAERVPPVAVRLRRDFGALLSLIRAHAVLHQRTRARDEAKRIIATLDDYAVVRELVGATLAEGVESTVAPIVRETVTTVTRLATDAGVMARAVAEELRIDKSNASRRLSRAADVGYLRNLEDRRGKPARWVLGEPLPEDVALLPEPADLADGCAVARSPEGKECEPLDPDDPDYGYKLALARAAEVQRARTRAAEAAE
jgi:hypothetical protein